jgi:hypothetical protein
MSKSKKILHLSSIALLLLFLSFYRDYVFRSINALLMAWDYNMDYPIHSSLSFLKNVEYNSVVMFKWVLTILFSLFFLLLLLWAVKVLFNNKNYRNISIATYIGVFAIAAVFMLCGYIFTSTTERMYEFARFVMGMAQSPLILMILVPIFLFAEKQEMNKKT